MGGPKCSISPRRAAYLAGDGPLGYLITFRCRGTWLHGDARGSVDRAHSTFATPMLEADPAREQYEAAELRGAPLELDTGQRAVAGAAIREACQHRGWSLAAISVRTNHVHLVVSATATPETVLDLVKARFTLRLRESGLLPAGDKPWARHGSTRYLWTAESLETACRYVNEGQ